MGQEGHSFFVGHALTGVSLTVFGFRTMILALSKFYKRSNIEANFEKRGEKFFSTATFLTSIRGHEFQMEGFLKMLLSMIGIVMSSPYFAGEAFAADSWHHITMLSFNAFNGLIDLIIFYGVSIPDKSDYMALLFATLVEYQIFSNHLHGRTELDAQVHRLLLVAVIFSSVSCIAEMNYRREPIYILLRGSSFMLQGTWFLQISFTIYSPFEGSVIKVSEHELMMTMVSIFCWHLFAIMMLMLIFGYFIQRFSRYNTYRNDYTILEVEDPKS